MYDIGVVPGKFLPPHRGHLLQIINAATLCKMLYVVVSDNRNISRQKCLNEGLDDITLELRALWLSVELASIDNIKVLMIDESDIAEYPDGSKDWCKLLCETIPEKIDVIFGGEKEYQDTYMRYFEDIEYIVFDYKRSRYPISGTVIRKNYLKNWDYILGSARAFFAKRVLISGTESCGKTTIVKYLAKIYHTSWTEEYGRHYSKLHLGGNENLFTVDDFEKIAIEQVRLDDLAMKGANRITFFDTDAVITQYYCQLYLNQYNPNLERYIMPSKYDVVFLLSPNVQWIDDGLRFKNEQNEREQLHEKLLQMYIEAGFKDKIVIVNDDNYNDRLKHIIEYCDKFLLDI